MKRTLGLIILLSLLAAADGYAAVKKGHKKSGRSLITVNFQVPPNWKKVSDNLYTLKDFDKTFKQSKKFLSEGHQPWRLESVNTAAVCLWDFGVKDNTEDIFKFADRLTIINENELYMLKAGKRQYYVYVRVNKTIPIAYKLAILKD